MANPRGTPENLKKGENMQFAGDRAVELGRKGGQAYAQKRREAKTFAAAMKLLLKEKASREDMQRQLEEMGYANSKLGAICLNFLQDLESDADPQKLKIVLDVIGESPKINIGISTEPSTAEELRNLSDEELRKLAERNADASNSES